MVAFMPAPARASAPVCQLLLRDTPPVTVDLDGDGNSDFRSPRIENVTLCADSWAYAVTNAPEIDFCGAGWHPTCVAVRVTLSPVEGQVGGSAELCYSIDGWPTCHTLTTPPLSWPPRMVACIGVDLGGGYPCTGSVFTFE